jgi:hypothetical protein
MPRAGGEKPWPGSGRGGEAVAGAATTPRTWPVRWPRSTTRLPRSSARRPPWPSPAGSRSAPRPVPRRYGNWLTRPASAGSVRSPRPPSTSSSSSGPNGVTGHRTRRLMMDGTGASAPRLPEPTGPYPAEPSDGPRARYMTPAESELQLTSRGITGVPPDGLSTVRTNGVTGAAPQSRHSGLPLAATSGLSSTSTCAASRKPCCTSRHRTTPRSPSADEPEGRSSRRQPSLSPARPGRHHYPQLPPAHPIDSVVVAFYRKERVQRHNH